jgi:hypothetical protein
MTAGRMGGASLPRSRSRSTTRLLLAATLLACQTTAAERYPRRDEMDLGRRDEVDFARWCEFYGNAMRFLFAASADALSREPGSSGAPVGPKDRADVEREIRKLPRAQRRRALCDVLLDCARTLDGDFVLAADVRSIAASAYALQAVDNPDDLPPPGGPPLARTLARACACSAEPGQGGAALGLVAACARLDAAFEAAQHAKDRAAPEPLPAPEDGCAALERCFVRLGQVGAPEPENAGAAEVEERARALTLRRPAKAASDPGPRLGGVLIATCEAHWNCAR